MLLDLMDRQRIGDYIIRQVEQFLVFKDEGFEECLWQVIDSALERFELCYRNRIQKYSPGNFPCYNADAYVGLLYLVSNEIWRRYGNHEFAEKIYLLNRYINSVDIFYNRNLPSEFLLNHPLGTILGDATYGERFVAFQGVTVGGNSQFELPEIGEGVVLYAGAKVIGRSKIGKGCQIGAGVTIYNEDIDAGSTVVLDRSVNRVFLTKDDYQAIFFQ